MEWSLYPVEAGDYFAAEERYARPFQLTRCPRATAWTTIQSSTAAPNG